MKIIFSNSFEKDYKKLPSKIQKLLDEQLLMLLENLRYPSLNYRFTFEKINDGYFLRRVGTHPILNNP